MIFFFQQVQIKLGKRKARRFLHVRSKASLWSERFRTAPSVLMNQHSTHSRNARMIDVYLGLPRGRFLQLESVTQSNLATDFVKKKPPLEKPPNGYQ